MTAFLVTILLICLLGACVSLDWLSREELPQPPPRSRKKVVIALVVDVLLVCWASWLLWGRLS